MRFINLTSSQGIISTYESYSNNQLFLYSNNLIIPYINVQIIETDNSGILKNGTFVDYSYLIIKSTAEFTWSFQENGEDKYSKIKFDDSSDCLVDYFGASGIGQKYIGYEFRIKFRSIFLASSSFNLASQKSWYPINTPLHKENMNSLEVRSFFGSKTIPEKLCDFLGCASADVVSIRLDDPAYYARKEGDDWWN